MRTNCNLDTNVGLKKTCGYFRQVLFVSNDFNLWISNLHFKCVPACDWKKRKTISLPEWFLYFSERCVCAHTIHNICNIWHCRLFAHEDSYGRDGPPIRQIREVCCACCSYSIQSGRVVEGMSRFRFLSTKNAPAVINGPPLCLCRNWTLNEDISSNESIWIVRHQMFGSWWKIKQKEK